MFSDTWKLTEYKYKIQKMRNKKYTKKCRGMKWTFYDVCCF